VKCFEAAAGGVIGKAEGAVGIQAEGGVRVVVFVPILLFFE